MTSQRIRFVLADSADKTVHLHGDRLETAGRP